MVTHTKMKNGESARDHTRLRTQRKRSIHVEIDFLSSLLLCTSLYLTLLLILYIEWLKKSSVWQSSHVILIDQASIA